MKIKNIFTVFHNGCKITGHNSVNSAVSDMFVSGEGFSERIIADSSGSAPSDGYFNGVVINRPCEITAYNADPSSGTLFVARKTVLGKNEFIGTEIGALGFTPYNGTGRVAAVNTAVIEPKVVKGYGEMEITGILYLEKETSSEDIFFTGGDNPLIKRMLGIAGYGSDNFSFSKGKCLAEDIIKKYDNNSASEAVLTASGGKLNIRCSGIKDNPCETVVYYGGKAAVRSVYKSTAEEETESIEYTDRNNITCGLSNPLTAVKALIDGTDYLEASESYGSALSFVYEGGIAGKASHAGDYLINFYPEENALSVYRNAKHRLVKTDTSDVNTYGNKQLCICGDILLVLKDSGTVIYHMTGDKFIRIDKENFPEGYLEGVQTASTDENGNYCMTYKKYDSVYSVTFTAGNGKAVFAAPYMYTGYRKIRMNGRGEKLLASGTDIRVINREGEKLLSGSILEEALSHSAEISFRGSVLTFCNSAGEIYAVNCYNCKKYDIGKNANISNNGKYCIDGGKIKFLHPYNNSVSELGNPYGFNIPGSGSVFLKDIIVEENGKITGIYEDKLAVKLKKTAPASGIAQLYVKRYKTPISGTLNINLQVK